jgi:hypothetical protein
MGKIRNLILEISNEIKLPTNKKFSSTDRNPHAPYTWLSPHHKRIESNSTNFHIKLIPFKFTIFILILSN